jgi:hypothetical protein
VAGTNLGPLTLKIMANADSMSGTINAASKQISKFAATSASAFKGAQTFAGPAKLARDMATFAGDAFANPLKAANDVLLGGAAHFVGMVPYVGGALALPLRAVQGGVRFALDAYDDAASRITELGKGAMRTGMSVESFQVFSIMADGAAKAEKAMYKFGQSLAEAQFAAVGTRTKFDDLGLDGKRLADLYGRDAAAAFGEVGDRLARMGSPALQAHAAMELFGKAGKDLLPALLKGSAGIEEIRAKMDQFGTGVTGGMVASVRAAGKVARDVKMLWEGLSNQIVLAVAPIVEVVGRMMGKLPIGFKGLGEKILSMIDAVGGTVARLWDDFGAESSRLWGEFKDFALAAVDAIGDHIALMLKSQLAAGVKDTVFAAFVPGYEQGGRQAMEAYEQAKKKNKELKDLKDQADKAKPPDLPKPPGAALEGWKRFMDEVNRARQAAGSLGDVDPFAPYQKRANDMKEAVKGPLEAYRNSMLEIQTISSKVADMQAAEAVKARKNAGMDALGLAGPRQQVDDLSRLFDQRTQALSAYKAAQAVMGAVPEKRFAGAALKDSVEAYSAIVAYQSKPDGVQDRMAAGIDELKAIQKEQARIGQETLDYFKANPVTVMGF